MRLGTILGEIHRRSVWQVLGSYAVVAWVILQLAETLAGLIGFPLWFGPTVVTVVLMGFPVLLVTSLMQGGARDGEGDDDVREGSPGGDPLPAEAGFVGLLRRSFTWRNALAGAFGAGLLVLVGAAGYSGMRSAGIGPLGSLMARGIFDSEERLILTDFEDRTQDGTLGETVAALFRIDLSQSPSIVLLDRSQISQALVRMAREPTDPVTYDVGLEMAQREGIKAVVTGEVLPLGPGAVVSAQLVAASNGETLVALRETARTIDAVPDAVDRLSAQLRERIGESLRSIQGDPPLQEVTTASLPALRKYVQAEWAADMGDVPTARALIQEALAMDSTFAMAFRKLGVFLSNEGGDQEEAREAFTRAYEGRERLTDRERYLAEAAYHTYVTEDPDAAIRAYQNVLGLFPNDGIAANNLAILYSQRGDKAQALELYANAIERGTAPAVTYTNAVEVLFGLEEPDSAAAILAGFLDQHPEHPAGLQFSAALASAQFDYDVAEGYVEDLLAAFGDEPRWQMWGEVELANYAMLHGKLEEGVEGMLRALAIQEESEAEFTDQPRPVFEALGRSELLLYFAGDSAGALSILDEALAGSALDTLSVEKRGYPEFARLYAEAGEVDRAREVMASHRSLVSQAPSADGNGAKDGPAYRELNAEAAISLAAGDPQGAVETLREARAAYPDCTLCGLQEMGEAFEALAMPDSAEARYRTYLEEKQLFRSGTDNMRLHRVLLGLGRVYEALDRPGEAVRHYRRFVELWADADPALQPRVEAVRARLRVLEADPS